MKSSKSEIQAKVYRIPTIQFEEHPRLTSFAGLVVFMGLFQRLGLKGRLQRCFSHLGVAPIFGYGTMALLLVVHLLLGFRRLRGLDYYRHDPLVARVLGLRKLPDVSTVSRALSSVDAAAVEAFRRESRTLVLEGLQAHVLARLTLDFDGTVQSTKGHAEGTAVGFNKVKKGARSYYPLFCTVAQSGQFLDLHHRSGNVHDSNGAPTFMRDCIRHVRKGVPGAVLESRMDSAFFNDDVFPVMEAENVEFTCSVPFERFSELKALIENRKRWTEIDGRWACFESEWKPKCWKESYRMILIRQRRPAQRKGPMQLDLFEPRDDLYDYKVIATNKEGSARSVLWFHNGRGSQEKILGEGKQHVALDVIPTKTLLGNQLFTITAMLTHNLTRQLQMETAPPAPRANAKRAALWEFAELGTLRQQFLHLAGRFTRPQGELNLHVSDNPAVRALFTRYGNSVGTAGLSTTPAAA